MTDPEEQVAEVESENGQAPSGNAAERERSGTRYPYYDLDEAEKFVRSVQASGGNEVLEDDLLKHLNLSRTTKSWVYKLSTAREFGLIERKGQKAEARITITDLGRRLMRPGDDNELAASRVAAFLSPPLYKKLFDRYKGAPVPQAQFLANLLNRDHKLVDSVTEPAATAFISSAKHAGLVNGSNVLTEPKAGERQKEEVAPREGEGAVDSKESAKTLKVPDNFIAHQFPLRKNLTVTIPLPIDITKRDVARLQKWMDTLIIEEDET